MATEYISGRMVIGMKVPGLIVLNMAKVLICLQMETCILVLMLLESLMVAVSINGKVEVVTRGISAKA